MAMWAFDIDGTIDAYPEQMRTLMTALKAAGHVVVVLTGSEDSPISATDVQEKADYLAALGVNQGAAYDRLVVVAKPHDLNKTQWLKANNAAALFDNAKDNAKAAPCLVLVPWQTRE